MTSNLIQAWWQRVMASANLRRNAHTSGARTRKSTILNLEELDPRVLLSGAPASIAPYKYTAEFTLVNTEFNNMLYAIVTDQSGNAVSGVSVTFAAPTSGASASFPNGSLAITGSNGEAYERVVANAVPGSYSVTATVSGDYSQLPFRAIAADIAHPAATCACCFRVAAHTTPFPPTEVHRA